MKLSFEQIKSITKGAVRIDEFDGLTRFFRFTKEQEELYKETNTDFYKKTFATAGVKLLFKTDSKHLSLKVKVTEGSSRKYFSFDVFVNGKAIGYIDNFSDIEIPENYTGLQLSLGDFSKSFCLGEGFKTVCIYFPWSVSGMIEEISVDDGSVIEPVELKKKLLVYGDSITQGYDALRPSNRYSARLAEAFGAEGINKGIGGERFFPELSRLADSFEPDYITVAYGTNDWSNSDEKSFLEKCKAFYAELCNNYPDSKIFAITPIWRKDFEEYRDFGEFQKVEEDIRNSVKNSENITVIRGFDFVPKDEKYFADLRLHPNDSGFDFYFENLYSQLIRQ